MEHPYTPPKADIEKSPSGSRMDLSAFPQVRTLLVLIYGTITLGVYYIYWVYSRSKILNTLNKNNQLSMGLVNTYVGISIPNMVLSLTNSFTQSSTLSFVSIIFSLITTVIFLVWVFGFRSRLHEIANISPGERYWANGFLTFFINVLYMNYKINQIQLGDK